MANPEHLAILKQRVGTWNEWREQHRDVRPDLTGADLASAQLDGVDFSAARLARADLTNSSLRTARLTDGILIDAKLINADLSGANLRRAELVGADLTDANLFYSRLQNANLAGAHLNRANIPHSYLDDAVLRDADLSDSDFEHSDLSGADLSGANLHGASLANADLTEARLAGANLRRVYLSGTRITGCDLKDVLGLESVEHLGPSYVSIETIYKSDGKIPAAFLPGCGVPDSFIAQIPALVGALQPIQFYSCFISYSTKDEEFARRLHERMRAEKLRVWFAPEDIQGGRKLHEQIERAIQVHDRLLLVLSENSVHSDWVMTEIRSALKVEKKDGWRKLFPIRLCGFDTLRKWECFDADFGKDLANEVRQYFMPDFSNWKDYDHFEAAFAKLMRDLRPSEL
jgi:uncharacterized protein YjbI with pentapeptide repeats